MQNLKFYAALKARARFYLLLLVYHTRKKISIDKSKKLFPNLRKGGSFKTEQNGDKTGRFLASFPIFYSAEILCYRKK